MGEEEAWTVTPFHAFINGVLFGFFPGMYVTALWVFFRKEKI
jgi:hypothetical protein